MTSAKVWLVIATSNSRPSIVFSVNVSSSAWYATTDPAIVSEKVKCILESIGVGSSSGSVSCLETPGSRCCGPRPCTARPRTAAPGRAPRCRRATAFAVSANTSQRRSSSSGHGEVVRGVVHVHHHVQVGLERLLAREREGEHARDRVAPLGLVELEPVPADVLRRRGGCALPVRNERRRRLAWRRRSAIICLKNRKRLGVLLDQRPVEPARARCPGSRRCCCRPACGRPRRRPRTSARPARGRGPPRSS